MTYLREVHFHIHGQKDILDIFSGDIKEDKKQWKKYHNADARYFILSESYVSDER